MMTPLMLPGEIKVLERALMSLSARPIRILEWGSGGSTVHFTQFLKERGIPYQWTSIEYNKRWYEKVKEMVDDDPHTELVLFDNGNDDIEQQNMPMDEYVAYPRTLGKVFDFILVDGRKRRRCLLEARQIVSPHGFVLLHDAQREYYHSAFSAYPRGRFVSGRLWLGLTTPRSPLTWFFDVPRSAFEQAVFSWWRAVWKIYAATPLRRLVHQFHL